MNGLEITAKMIIFLGLTALIVGTIMLFTAKAGFVLFRLPGDIIIKRDNYTLYFPWISMIIISIVLSIILNFLFRK
jgi:hypothetical protein